MNELNTLQRSNYINRQDIEWAHQQDETKFKQQFYSGVVITAVGLIIASWCWMFYQKITA